MHLLFNGHIQRPFNGYLTGYIQQVLNDYVTVIFNGYLTVLIQYRAPVLWCLFGGCLGHLTLIDGHLMVI